MTTDTGELMTTAEAACRLGVSRERMRQITVSGALERVQRLGRWVYRRADVEAFAQLNRAPGKRPPAWKDADGAHGTMATGVMSGTNHSEG